ncbi:MAG: AmmeMemoRadiSam system protein B [Elusimicrobia bacterium]|nr:AmmeMemoRadiSam system protein B [Elusimicrobiota bacterium]
MIREPAVSGMFYPSDREKLNEMVDYFIENALSKVEEKKYRGIIVPHAGYIFSGRTQGFSYTAEIPERAIIFGVNHHAQGAPVSLFGEGKWRVPNGILDCDSEIYKVLMKESDVFALDPHAHLEEHSIEVQLPFLIRRNPQVLITPISIYDYRIDVAREIGKAVSKILFRFPNTILIASSDFSHYVPDEVARKKDHIAIAKILESDAEGLWEVVEGHNITMCGLGPVGALLFSLGKAKASELFYETSATASQDYSNVVGYASIVFE